MYFGRLKNINWKVIDNISAVYHKKIGKKTEINLEACSYKNRKCGNCLGVTDVFSPGMDVLVQKLLLVADKLHRSLFQVKDLNQKIYILLCTTPSCHLNFPCAQPKQSF